MNRFASRFFRSLILVGMLFSLLPAMVVTATGGTPVPVPCGTAVVDGDPSEWDSISRLSIMYEAGNSDKDELAEWKGVYDSSTGVFYFFVKVLLGEGMQSAEDAYLKIVELGSSTQVDGNSGNDENQPNFEWVFDGEKLIGFEASITIAQGTWTANPHINVNYNGEDDRTAAVKNRALKIKIDCPEPDPATITIVKTVEGGEAGPNDFTYRINGKIVPQGVPQEVPAGTYTMSEDAHNDYVPGLWGGDCDKNGVVTVEPGDEAVCTITNTAKKTTGSIEVRKYNDLNDNGEKDPGEEYLPGFNFELKQNDVVLDTITTGENGIGTFEEVPFGTYQVCEVPKDGWENTGSDCQTIELTAKLGTVTVFFGNKELPPPPPPKGDLEVRKFHDRNGDKLPGGDQEEFLPGWVITLFQGLQEIAQAITDDEGKVIFADLDPGDYTACETMQNGWETTTGVCVDATVKDGEVITVYIGNKKEPTALPRDSQPGDPGIFGLFMPFASAN